MQTTTTNGVAVTTTSTGQDEESAAPDRSTIGYCEEMAVNGWSSAIRRKYRFLFSEMQRLRITDIRQLPKHAQCKGWDGLRPYWRLRGSLEKYHLVGWGRSGHATLTTGDPAIPLFAQE